MNLCKMDHSMKIPWMSKKAISSKAEALIRDFERKAGYPVSPPIPVDQIIERSLGLEIQYVDLEKILRTKDVLGAIYAKSKRMCINERLFEHSSEGRLAFTCAHEAGHWVLHRRYMGFNGKDESRQGAVAGTMAGAGDTMEWQADYFASCLLMPEEAIREAFRKICGPRPVVIRSERDAVEDSRCEAFAEQWPHVAAAMCELGGFSNVSRHAMIIRLQDLGLIVNETGKRLDWDVLC